MQICARRSRVPGAEPRDQSSQNEAQLSNYREGGSWNWCSGGWGERRVGGAHLCTPVLNLKAHPAHKLLLAGNVTLSPLHSLALSNLLFACTLQVIDTAVLPCDNTVSSSRGKLHAGMHHIDWALVVLLMAAQTAALL